MAKAKKKSRSPNDRLEAERNRKARVRRNQNAMVAEIGEPPLSRAAKTAGTRLRKKHEKDLAGFLQAVFPQSCGLRPYGPAQRDAIANLQSAIVSGGNLQLMLPRGYGKTSQVVGAALWAILYGHRRFVAVFGSSADRASEIIDSWQLELRTNQQLLGMFPDICWPIVALEDKHQRCKSQTFRGRRTMMTWTAQLLALPTVEHVASGAVLAAKPLGSARGTHFRTEDGTVLRPDLVILDDVQRDGDATSPTTINRILSTIRKSVLRLGGRETELAVISCATPIAAGDVAETIAADPSWTTVRYRMVTKWPDNQELWNSEYKTRLLGHDSKIPGDQLRARQDAAEFYQAHRAEMDAGAEVSWQWAYAWKGKPQTEFSALQAAYNILFSTGLEAFNSECQCDAQTIQSDELEAILSKPKINAKRSHLPAWIAPNFATTLVAGIDVQAEALYWSLAAFAQGFTGQLLAYGVFPEQPSIHHEYRRLTTKLSDVFPRNQQAGRVYQALEAVLMYFNGLTIVREDETQLPLSRVMIDRGFETDAVDLFLTQSPYRNMTQGSMGFGVRASDTPIAARAPKPGQRKGHNLIIYPPASGAGGRHYVGFDANSWKTAVHEGLRTSHGDPGCFSLYAHERADWHNTLADHLRAEFVKKTFGNGRWVDEWKEKPSKPDNHWFDSTVLCFVAASTVGITPIINDRPSKPPSRTARYVKL